MNPVTKSFVHTTGTIQYAIQFEMAWSGSTVTLTLSATSIPPGNTIQAAGTTLCTSA